MQLVCHINAVHDPHVVAFEYGLAIQLDCGEGVESVKGQNMPRALACGLHGRKSYTVRPCLLSNPLALQLIEAEEGILNPKQRVLLA